MDLEKLWHLVLTSLWAPETYVKLAFVAVTSPFWWPLVRAMRDEVMPVFREEEPADGRRPPGEDPFLSIPLASYRNAQRARMARGGGGPVSLAPRGAPRRRSF